MKKMIMAALAVIFATVAMAQNAIQVSGKAEKKVTPNEIYVSITIKDGDVKNQTVAQIESTMKSRLKALDIDVANNLKATDMDNSLKKKKQVDTRRSYELKVGDVWTLGAVFDMLSELGVADADVTRVSHSQMEEFRREVRVTAIRDAKANAEQIAAAIGQSIGPAIYINDNGYISESTNQPLTRAIKLRGTASVYDEDTAEQSINFQDITLSYNISAKFILNTEN
jgi:uncharacterized protein YggE